MRLAYPLNTAIPVEEQHSLGTKRLTRHPLSKLHSLELLKVLEFPLAPAIPQHHPMHFE
jgi:hypothetical protein